MDHHDLVSRVKELALELGRVPTRAEFQLKTVGGDNRIRALFGTYSALLMAAGLETHTERQIKKVSNAVFNKNIESYIEKYEPIVISDPEIYPTIATISDIHWPFSCQRVVDRFIEFVGDTKPEWVILNGDAWDMYSHSKFPRSHNVFTPREEESRSRKMNEEFWEKIISRSPQSKCYQLLGNHDVRPMKRVLEAYPEAEDWIQDRMTKLFSFTGVKTIMDPREELEIGNIIVFHGYRSKLGDHRDYTLLNCINGHTHVGGVVFRQIRGKILFELNSGFSGDPFAKGLTYTQQKITNWTPGWGYVDKYGPRFIPS